jgi:hypothetical protein
MILSFTLFYEGINDFPVPGYDYTFSTYMNGPEGATVDSYTPDNTVAGSGSSDGTTASSSSSSTPIIAGVIAGVAFVALIAAAVIYKRRRTTTGSSMVMDQTQWLSVTEATQELKERFGYAFGEVKPLFPETDDSALQRYQKRHMASFESILKEENQGSMQYDNRPELLELSGSHSDVRALSNNEADIMLESKQFIWDADSSTLMLVNSKDVQSPLQAAASLTPDHEDIPVSASQ